MLVDEYQDTNRVQADILKLLRPDGQGLTVVGDDAQSIYSFRAATVRNILDFPTEFPGATIVKLEQNYRSTQPILAATNHVIGQAQRRFRKDLWSARDGGELPQLVTCQDENDQAEYVIREILQRREEGIDLRRQAVLYRTSHHSVLLEGELTRRNIPYVKFGGLKFLEAAHIKDLLSLLRLAENPRDLIAGIRVLQLLPGIGPKRARQLMELIVSSRGDWRVWDDAAVGKAAGATWPQLLDVLRQLTAQPAADLASQVSLARRFYEPILQDKYDNPAPRKRDLEQIEQLAARFADRQSLLTQLALDPPESTEDFAGPPLLDEDYLILSTIHSAKGLEWDVVFVIHAADGNIPSDMATRQRRGNRRRAAAVLRRPDAGQEPLVRLPAAALLPRQPRRLHRPPQLRPADAVSAAAGENVLRGSLGHPFQRGTAALRARRRLADQPPNPQPDSGDVDMSVRSRVGPSLFERPATASAGLPAVSFRLRARGPFAFGARQRRAGVRGSESCGTDGRGAETEAISGTVAARSTSSLRRISRSIACSSFRSSWSQNDTAMPDAPARPVRPIRCTYISGSCGRS